MQVCHSEPKGHSCYTVHTGVLGTLILGKPELSDPGLELKNEARKYKFHDKKEAYKHVNTG